MICHRVWMMDWWSILAVLLPPLGKHPALTLISNKWQLKKKMDGCSLFYLLSGCGSRRLGRWEHCFPCTSSEVIPPVHPESAWEFHFVCAGWSSRWKHSPRWNCISLRSLLNWEFSSQEHHTRWKMFQHRLKVTLRWSKYEQAICIKPNKKTRY